MSLTAALLILAQSAAPQAAPQAADTSARASRGVSVQVQASARIIRPAQVTFDASGEGSLKVSATHTARVQQNRDSNGTVWADFE
ncbi:hypothetical protein INR77_03285 [Erythrobacter sp. SCSIO 43205]|uniref:hypothetical protein n=1 Tax=Erythrobacter sp. SCSIO 43205 TaxID=2779361 RepID=UPI001CA91D6F|nr:hypothetical protein [Erythrobacter sp. SCSIO 43205]UAB78763.1 hypothetical protein INR77_03285 [Erythrobacter sp. SCSIO 43205]